MKSRTELNRRIIFWVAVLAAVSVAGICSYLLLVSGGVKSETVQILQNGEIIREIDLRSLAEPVDVTVEADGRLNVVRVSRDGVYMLEADCPDQICVRQGTLGAVPIVCLPNRVTVRFAYAPPSAVDAELG
ncbi:MAG: NusG domain II-containing protein [Oscillospiraceae bacterium]|jgi:hypothetical protein|nr:NusG domain II-containing protein [Oscillospiraceae bacterium]